MTRCSHSLILAAAAAALAFTPRLSAQTTAADSALVRRADHARIEGNPTATVWLVEVSDFQCPFCKRWHDQTYPAIKRDYVDAGKVRLAYINFPLSMHKNAMPAAQAAMCAATQDKFWPMQDALFQAQAAWEKRADPAPVFDSLASLAGVNVTAMRACITSGLMKSTIAGDMDRAKSEGVGSTPAFKVTGQSELIEGAQPLALFRQALDAALARAAGAPKP